MRYPIAIEPGTETTAFSVVVPDLPGCFSAGDTLDEAVAGAEEAAAAWIPDASITEPVKTSGQGPENPMEPITVAVAAGQGVCYTGNYVGRSSSDKRRTAWMDRGSPG